MGRFSVPVMLFLAFIPGLILPRPMAAQTSFEWSLPGDKIEEIEGRGLLLRSYPTLAKVFIDGIERGRTPLRLEELRAGTYFIRIQKEGYSERRFRLSVRTGSLMEVSVELKEAVGRVLLKLSKIQGVEGSPSPDMLPLDPRISVDGRSFQSPALELPVGFRTILVRAFGWEDSSVTFYVEEDSFRELELNMKPAPFKLSGAGLNRPRFNPHNAGSLGTSSFNFEVSGPGKGSFTVLDPEGKLVVTRSLEVFDFWSQSVVWNGRDSLGEILSDGLYTLMVHAFSIPSDGSAPVEDSLVQRVQLDSTRVIFPLTLSSGKSGLLFAPLPSLLPPGSFQVEGSLLAGSPPESGGPWKSLPFSAAVRFSPLETLELSAALNVLPLFEGDTGTGFGGGVKWAFLNSGGRDLPLALGLLVSWTADTGLMPFGMASGIELYVPFSLDLGSIFSVTLSPAALWTGDDGFPWEGVPRLLVSGGFLMRFKYLSAGLSVRQEYNFSSGVFWPPFSMIGCELKFLPPPSSFVFSLMGGVWVRDSGIGAFGGLGIGMIY